MSDNIAGAQPEVTRANVHGHIVRSSPEGILGLRRLAAMALSQVFMHAKEHGSAPIQLGEDHWTLHRQSDHTFKLDRGSPLRPVV